MDTKEGFIPIIEPEETFLQPGEYTRWAEKGFDLDHALGAIKGPIVEVGGPTFPGYSNIFPDQKFANILPNGKKILISNVVLNEPRFKDTSALEYAEVEDDYPTYPEMKDCLDVVLDGGKMPFANGSIGAVLFSYLPKFPFGIDTRGETICETYRVLEPGGLLVVQGLREEEVAFAEEQGFRPRIIYKENSIRALCDVVFSRS